MCALPISARTHQQLFKVGGVGSVEHFLGQPSALIARTSPLAALANRAAAILRKERWILGKAVKSRPGSKGKLVQELAEKRPAAGEGCRTVLVVCATFRAHLELPR